LTGRVAVQQDSGTVQVMETALIVTVVILALLAAASALASVVRISQLEHRARADRLGQSIAHTVGPARRLVLELEVPSHGGLPQWGFANVDPTFEQVEAFTDEHAMLVALARERLLECASTNSEPDVRNAAAICAVRVGAAWMHALARLRAEVADRAGGEMADMERAPTAWHRLSESTEHLASLLAGDRQRDVNQ
jgi:hypothetical protein